MDFFGDDLSICSDIEDEGNLDSSLALPEKSRKRYESTYEGFKKYLETRNMGTSEPELMTYFLERAEILKSPSSLWCEYSMLKTTLLVNDNIDISMYPKLKDYLKKKNYGYRPKKSKTFTREEIYTFLTQAPDDIYLLIKVVLIMGLAGACRRDELCRMKIDDVDDKDTIIIVQIWDSKNKNQRTFTIVDNERENLNVITIVRKYMTLRPKHTESRRFFLRYHLGKCVNQVVGINTFAKIPSQVAKFLNLDRPNEFTGHSFRRTSAALLANTGVGILGGWKFSAAFADMCICGVIGCKHNNSRDTCNFFRLPDDPKLRSEWLFSLRRDPDTIPKVLFVCSCHFRDGKKENGPGLFMFNESSADVNQPSTSLAKLRAEKVKSSDSEPIPSTSTALSEEFDVKTSDLAIEHVDVGSISAPSEDVTDNEVTDFLPESDELPALPRQKRPRYVPPKEVKIYCRLCLNPVTKNQMVCLGDFHDLNYQNRTVQFKRNKILQTEMYLRMIRMIMPNFDHELVYNPIMCSDCSSRLQMASDFVEQCMATQKLIQQYKDTYNPTEKMVSCEDVVQNKTLLPPSSSSSVASHNPKKRKITKTAAPTVVQPPSEIASPDEDDVVIMPDVVNVKTEQFDEMEDCDEKYEICQEEIPDIKKEQDFDEEQYEKFVPEDTIVKSEPCSTEMQVINIPKEIPYASSVGVIPSEVCSNTPVQYFPRIQSETLDVINPMPTPYNFNLPPNCQNDPNS